MFNPSNLYAEKVFSEHPTGLWSLDDSADYISLYSDSKANVFTWNVDGGIVSEFTNFLGAPFSDSSVTKILPDLPKGLKLLDCSCNELEYLPKLPNGLKELYCAYNKLNHLPNLNNLSNLEYIYRHLDKTNANDISQIVTHYNYANCKYGLICVHLTRALEVTKLIPTQVPTIT